MARLTLIVVLVAVVSFLCCVDVGTGVSTGGGTGGRPCDKNRIKKDVGSEFESDAGGLSQNAGLMNFLKSLASALNSNSRSGFESRIPEAARDSQCIGGRYDEWKASRVCERTCEKPKEEICYNNQRSGCRCVDFTLRKADGNCVAPDDCEEKTHYGKIIRIDDTNRIEVKTNLGNETGFGIASGNTTALGIGIGPVNGIAIGIASSKANVTIIVDDDVARKKGTSLYG